MQVILTTDEKLKMVYEALTTGLPYFPGYGLALEYDQGEYVKARNVLNANPTGETICIEDIQMQMVRMGFGLNFVDEEGDEEPVTLTLSLIESQWDKVPHATIMAFVTENYDADDADRLFQYILFGQLVYG